MAENTSISWTDHTVNFWHGCAKVSPGCANCYAETMSKRWGKDIWGVNKDRERKKAGWKDILKFDKQARKDGRMIKVFVESMSDFFEDHPQLPPMRAEAIPILEDLTNTHVQLLTKRIENVSRFAPEWMKNFPPHIWIGTSIEDQKRADQRIPELLKIPARVRWLSCEPLLEQVDILTPITKSDNTIAGQAMNAWLHWVVVGGESGRGARPFYREWADHLLKQCQTADIPFFMKQLGANAFEIRNGERIRLNHFGKGENESDFPFWLQVREFPERHLRTSPRV